MSNGQSRDDKTVISITYLYIEKYVEGRDRDFGCLVGMANNKKMQNAQEHTRARTKGREKKRTKNQQKQILYNTCA